MVDNSRERSGPSGDRGAPKYDLLRQLAAEEMRREKDEKQDRESRIKKQIDIFNYHCLKIENYINNNEMTQIEKKNEFINKYNKICSDIVNKTSEDNSQSLTEITEKATLPTKIEQKVIGRKTPFARSYRNDAEITLRVAVYEMIGLLADVQNEVIIQKNEEIEDILDTANRIGRLLAAGKQENTERQNRAKRIRDKNAILRGQNTELYDIAQGLAKHATILQDENENLRKWLIKTETEARQKGREIERLRARLANAGARTNQKDQVIANYQGQLVQAETEARQKGREIERLRARLANAGARTNQKDQVIANYQGQLVQAEAASRQKDQENEDLAKRMKQAEEDFSTMNKLTENLMEGFNHYQSLKKVYQYWQTYQDYQNLSLKAQKDLSSEKLDLILKDTNVVLQLIEDLPGSDLVSFSREKISLMDKVRNESKTAEDSIKLGSHSRTIVQQTEDLFIQAREEFVRPLETSGLAVQDLQQFSRQIVKEYANKYFEQEFITGLAHNGIRLSDLSQHLQEKLRSFNRSTSLPGLLQDVLQNVARDTVENAMSEVKKDLVQPLIDYLPTDLTKDQMKTLLLVFVVARGKAKEKIIDQEKVIYTKKDRDAYEGVEQNFDTEDPKESGWGSSSDVRTIGREPESKSRFCNIINIARGTIQGYDNNQSPSHSYYRPDIVIYQIDLLLKKAGKTFGDFAITKTLSDMLANLDTIRSVQLALPKTVGHHVLQENEHTFEAGSDGWYAYKGSQTGYYPWFLSAQHQQALKGREPKRVLVKVGRNTDENEEDYLTLTTEFDEAWS